MPTAQGIVELIVTLVEFLNFAFRQRPLYATHGMTAWIVFFINKV